MELQITKANYEQEVLKSDVPVLLDLWATWCGPCKMIAPIVAEIAEEYAGKLKVGKVNVDDEIELAREFKIASIPTLVLIKDGKVAATSVGYRPKSEIVALL